MQYMYSIPQLFDATMKRVYTLSDLNQGSYLLLCCYKQVNAWIISNLIDNIVITAMCNSLFEFGENIHSPDQHTHALILFFEKEGTF